MTVIALNGPFFWFLIIGAAVGNYLCRVSFIALLGYVEEAPERVEQVLQFIPAAVLAALVLPDLLYNDSHLALSLGNSRLIAGVVAAIVGWKTENILVTIGIGMAVLYLLEALFH